MKIWKMISADTSHYLAKLVQTLEYEDILLLRRDYDVAETDADLKKWLSIPIKESKIRIPIKQI